MQGQLQSKGERAGLRGGLVATEKLFSARLESGSPWQPGRASTSEGGDGSSSMAAAVWPQQRGCSSMAPARGSSAWLHAPPEGF